MVGEELTTSLESAGLLSSRAFCAPTPLPWTGERMVPELTPPHTFWEHVYRYRFACRYVQKRRVLDIACGEGYGTAALRRAGADAVIGVDICPVTCRHATSKYNLDVRQGDATNIPLNPESVDVVVSFETIEHLQSPDLFLRECLRVLVPGGVVIISSPDRDLYRNGSEPNSYHHSELNRSEFRVLLEQFFGRVDLYLQNVVNAPALARSSLAALESPWKRVRGYWRLRHWALRDLCDLDMYEPKVSAKFRDDPVAAILTQDGPLTRLMNPLELRPSSNSRHERAMYQVAVCRKPKSVL